MINLPTLTNGTDKQIAFAAKIRADMIASAPCPNDAAREGLAGVVATKLTKDATIWIDTYTSVGASMDAVQGRMAGVRKLLNAICAASR